MTERNLDRRRRRRRPSAKPRSNPPSAIERVQKAMRELAAVARELSRNIEGAEQAVRSFDLAVEVCLDKRARSSDAARDLIATMRNRIEEIALAKAAFKPGRLYCLRCESNDCEHSRPPDSRAVFAGYGQTGRPEWTEFGSFLSARDDPRLERVFGERPSLVAMTQRDAELYANLLPGFATTRHRYFIMAQLCAGPFRLGSGDDAEPTVLTVQVVRAESESGRGRLGINLLFKNSQTPREETDFVGLPEALGPIRREIAAINRGWRGKKIPTSGVALNRLTNRCYTLMKAVSRDLEHRTRVDGRRTRHARERSRQGSRPTAKAFEEARRATDENILEDRQKKTVVVIGGRGRVHFFTPEGKHVTSVVYPGHVVKGRTTQKRWIPLAPTVVAGFRARIQPDPPSAS